MRRKWKRDMTVRLLVYGALMLSCTGVGEKSEACYFDLPTCEDPRPGPDAQEDSADNGFCFTITLDDAVPAGFQYDEHDCEVQS